MGTKLHSKAYFPGYYSTRDLNSVGNGMWALYDEDKTLQKDRLNDSFLGDSHKDRYIGYEKEKVKQTILKHELVFRDQLQELHRLYKRQRDLMNEFGGRELHKHLLPSETSKSSLIIQQTPFKDADDISRASDSFMIKGKSTCSKLLSHDGTHLKNYEFLKPEYKFQRKMFDLELPAEVSMNDEGKQQGERICGAEGIESSPLEKSSRSLFNLDMNLCPGSVPNNQNNGHALKFMLNSKRNHILADLNKPIWVEETSTIDPTEKVEVSVHLREDIKEHDIFGSLDSRSQSQSKELYQSCIGEKDGRSVINTIQSESVENVNGHLTCNSNAGMTRFDDHTSLGNISDESPSTLLRSLLVDPRKNLSNCGQSNAASQRMSTIFGVEISDGNQNRCTNIRNSPSSRTFIQQTDALDSESSCIPPRRKTCSAVAQNVASSQDNHVHRILSPFIGRPSNSVVQMPEFFEDKNTNNSRAIPDSIFEAVNQSAPCFGSQSTMIQHRYLDLNSYVTAANKLQNKVVSQHYSVLADTKMQCRDKQVKSGEGIYQMSLDSLQYRSQHFFNKVEIAKGPLKEFTSSTCGVDSGRTTADDCHSKSSSKILGIPIFNVPQISEVVISPNCPSKPTPNASTLDCDGASKDPVHNIESVNKREEKYLVADNGPSNYLSGLRHPIDLNLTLSEEETPSTPSVPVAVMKIAATEIDLEAPAVLESVTDVSSEAGHLEKKNKIFSKETIDDSCEQYEDLAKVAAEAIIDISVPQLDAIDPSCQLLEALPPVCLLWLADIISCYEGSAHESKVTKGSTNVDDASCEENVPQGMDYLEFMTLKLQDTKVEEYCYKPHLLDNCSDEDSRATSVAKRGRKGHARRGRQRRDFQRDILPGLVSLSRCEVSKDLQTIEKIFKASGHNWQSSLSQRRAARNGRGRKRLGSSAPSQTAAAVCMPPVQQPTCRGLEVEDRNLTGWGKRTRRLPRQRCSIVNHTATLNC